MPRGGATPQPDPKPASGRKTATPAKPKKKPVDPGAVRSRTQRGSPHAPPPDPRTDTVAHRQAFVDRLSKTPAGARKLAYFLKDLGYDMSVAGNKGYKFATHGFITLGTESDQVSRYNAAWTKTNGAGAAPAAAPAANRPPAGADGPGGGAGAGAGADSGLPDLSDTGTGAGIGTDWESIIGAVNPNTQKLLNAQAYAKNQAGMAFDPQIAETRLTQSRLAPQAKQNQLDIASWYRQVGDQQKQGLTATHSANEAALASVNSVGSNLVSAAGGNETAAGLVGAAATTDAGTIAAVGSSDEALANRLKELTSLEGASRGIDEKRYQSKLAQDTALQLTSLKGQKGAAFADALDKALSFNNTARQTNFANRLSEIQSQIGAEGLGLDIEGKQVDLASAKVDLAGKIMTYQAAVDLRNSGGRVTWNKMAPDAKAGVVQAAVAAALGPGKHPIDTYNRSRKKAYDWAVRFAGLNNPAMRQAIDSELWRSNANVWNKKK